MDSIQHFKQKLDLLDSMLSKLKSSHSRVTQLRRSVFVLKKLLKDQETIKSPYGPTTAIVRFSLQ